MGGISPALSLVRNASALRGASQMPDGSINWVVERARALREAGAVRGRGWSLAQACEHLALSMSATVNAQPSSAEWLRLGVLERARRRVMKHALLFSGQFPDGVPAPAVVIPSQDAELVAAIAALQQACGAFENKVRQRGAAWVDHPLLGPMTGPQWERFHHIHARHHFKWFSRGPAP